MKPLPQILVVAVGPIPCKGALGLWNVPADMLALLPEVPAHV